MSNFGKKLHDDTNLSVGRGAWCTRETTRNDKTRALPWRVRLRVQRPYNHGCVRPNLWYGFLLNVVKALAPFFASTMISD
jgi:hypothetical protein